MQNQGAHMIKEQEKTDTSQIIIWTKEKVLLKIECPICHDESNKPHILKVLHLNNHQYLNLYNCPHCECFFYYPIQVASYSQGADWEQEFSQKLYLEQVAGIDFMINFVSALQNNKINRVLEVGCGAGFALDFAKRKYGWQVYGVEPSPWLAKLGQKVFNVEIYNDYLENVTEVKNQTFDLVFSVEVIEHIEHPQKFLEYLKQKINSKGILAFTTPNAIKLSNCKSTPHLALQLLAPGFHLYLFSPKSLHILLTRMGFKYIKIIETGLQLLIYASMQKFNLSQTIRQNYTNYLTELLPLAHNESELHNGVNYRLFKELITQQKYSEAAQLWERFSYMLAAQYPNALLDPETTRNNLLDYLNQQNNTIIEAIGKIGPYNFISLYYYIGILELYFKNDAPTAITYFQSSYQLAELFQQIPNPFWGEVYNLLWPMRLQHGMSCLQADNIQEAILIFNHILENKNKRLFVPLTQDILMQAYLNLGKCKLRAGFLPTSIPFFIHAWLCAYKNKNYKFKDKIKTSAQIILAFLAEIKRSLRANKKIRNFS